MRLNPVLRWERASPHLGFYFMVDPHWNTCCHPAAAEKLTAALKPALQLHRSKPKLAQEFACAKTVRFEDKLRA